MVRGSNRTNRVRAVATALACLVTLVMGGTLKCELAEGDLLFVLTNDPDDPVACATSRGQDLSTNHVGIVHYCDDGVTVVEAIPASGVTVTPLDTFLTRAQNRVAVARLIDSCGVAAMVERALTYKGRPYDELFMLDEQEVYCSELVWLSYVRPDGSHVFDLAPMSFHDANGNLLPYWQEHYASRGLRVPSGALGTNPSLLSASPRLKIIYLP